VILGDFGDTAVPMAGEIGGRHGTNAASRFGAIRR